MRGLVALLAIVLVAIVAYGFKAGWFSADKEKIKADVTALKKIAKEKFASFKDAASKGMDSFSKKAGELKGAAADKAMAAKDKLAAKYKELNDKVSGVKDDGATEAEHKEVADLSKEFDDLVKKSQADVEAAGKDVFEVPPPKKN